MNTVYISLWYIYFQDLQGWNWWNGKCLKEVLFFWVWKNYPRVRTIYKSSFYKEISLYLGIGRIMFEGKNIVSFHAFSFKNVVYYFFFSEKYNFKCGLNIKQKS